MSFDRKYSVEDYPKNEKKLFRFLVDDFNFKLKERKESGFSFISEYVTDAIRVRLNYDFREQHFSFYLIYGLLTKFPNDLDLKNIKMFWDLFALFEADFDYMKTQPDEHQYLESLELNASLLKKYGGDLLRGKIWYWE
jgi:hypothetical protein